jgi:CRP-like cAMP-binding protein
MEASVQSYRNRLLELLDREDLDRLRPHLKPTIFDYRQSLYEANSPISSVYFPIDGVASLVNTMADGSAAEVGTIGNEGIVGLPVIFGDRLAPTSAYIQVPGSGLRLQAEVLRSEIDRSRTMRRIMLHYAHAFFNQVAQSAACNHFHSVEQRCCRWLLMTHDRVQSERRLPTEGLTTFGHFSDPHPASISSPKRPPCSAGWLRSLVAVRQSHATGRGPGQIIRATTGIFRRATTSAQLPDSVPMNTTRNFTNAGQE